MNNLTIKDVAQVTAIVARTAVAEETDKLRKEFSVSIEAIRQERPSVDVPSIIEEVKRSVALPTKIEITTTTATATATEPRVMQGVFHEEFPAIVKMVDMGLNVYLYGPAGTGKSHIARQVADALGLTFYTSQKLTTEWQIEGYGSASGEYISTPFYNAFVNGGLFLLDEFDASNPDVVTCLNMALANGAYSFPVVGLCKAHPNFRCMGAGNTVGLGANEKYTGRYRLDEATRNRFVFVELGYSEAIEQMKAGDDQEILPFLYAIRKASDGAVETGYRAIEQIKAVSTVYTDLKKVLSVALFKGMEKDTLRLFLPEVKSLPYDNKYREAFQNYVSW